MTALANRYEFVFLFDVTNGNPNGDPDAGNLPRLDPETNQGLVSDVCLKRKLRNYILLKDEPGNAIFIQEKQPLNPKIAHACEEVGLETFAKKGGGWEQQQSKRRSQSDIGKIQEWLCKHYFDIRTFGAVMSTGPNAGQIRGPVQLAFSRSVDPILPLEQSITRVTDVDKEEGEMGRKHIVPYGLYRAHGFVSAKLAERTGFTAADLELLWESLASMLDHDRSAARGEMAARGLYVFEHDSALGNAPAHRLFDLVQVRRRDGAADAPARRFGDYEVRVDRDAVPDGVRLIERL